MAQSKKRRRPNAGPPPTRNPRRDAAAATGGEGTAKGAERPVKRRRGEPTPPSFKGVLIRAGIIAALFFPALVYIGKESEGVALIFTAFAFAIMIPFGLLLDRLRYRTEMRRYQRKRAAAKPGKPS